MKQDLIDHPVVSEAAWRTRRFVSRTVLDSKPLRVAVFAGLSLLIAWYMGVAGPYMVREMPELFSFIEFFPLMVIIIFGFHASIAGEREGRMIDMVLVSPIPRWTIAAGRLLLAYLVVLVTWLLIGLPALVIPGQNHVTLGLVTILAYSFAVASFTIWASSISRRAAVARNLSFASVLLYPILLAAYDSLGTRQSSYASFADLYHPLGIAFQFSSLAGLKEAEVAREIVAVQAAYTQVVLYVVFAALLAIQSMRVMAAGKVEL